MTSEQASNLQTRWLRYFEGYDPGAYVDLVNGLTIRDFKAICASVLAQDEVKGQR